MVFVLPMELKIPADADLEGPAMAQLTFDPVQATFHKQKERERRHLRPIYIKGHVDSRPMTKMMVDGGSAVNVMSYVAYRKLGLGAEDLIGKI